MKYSKEQVEVSMTRLHELLKPGDTVYCILRSVARSGMSRRIDFYTVGLAYLSDYTAVVLGLRITENGVYIQGGGMDMGFHVVYELGGRMWPNGNPVGGYALNHQWL